MFKAAFRVENREQVRTLYPVLRQHGFDHSGVFGLLISSVFQGSPGELALPLATEEQALAFRADALACGFRVKISPCTETEAERLLVQWYGWDALLRQRLEARGFRFPDYPNLFEPGRTRRLVEAFPWDANAHMRMAAVHLIEGDSASALAECQAALAAADAYEQAVGRPGKQDAGRNAARVLMAQIEGGPR